MTTFIQIGTISYDNIEDPKELKTLESFEGEKEMADFAWIVNGDESLIKTTSLNPIYREWFDIDQVVDFLLGTEHEDVSRIIVDEDIDGISDFLEEIGWVKVRSYWNGTLTYERQ